MVFKGYDEEISAMCKSSGAQWHNSNTYECMVLEIQLLFLSLNVMTKYDDMMLY